ncbi:unnamed protein product [Clonostachys rosea]|uniref:ER-bound oxygenase mpaB/mpaB'/Rubber oxygenase catalytic domain-containing protein n=1 Tax=Bionectria ochroleuca TaxID=29856 RepID=A0ABY6UKX3_BIOOC|nr:unnamed protein product [Clonostachys rosea]
MDPQVFLLAGCLLIFLLIVIVTISCSANSLVHHWKDIRSTKLVWRNKYPSFEELHSLFDRGDIMLASVLVASSLQLLHPTMSEVLHAHSTYKSNPWRRVIRTMAFIFIMIRSNSSERQQVISWLQKLHRPIPLFVFETNVLVFATFAYGLVKTHQALGDITPEQVDAVVKGVMSMADKLDPKDLGRKVPSTIEEVEEYLQSEILLDFEKAQEINKEFSRLWRIRSNLRKHGVGSYFWSTMPLIRLALVKHWASALSGTVLAPTGRKESLLGRPFWWCARKIHCFFSHFHYSMCPQMLTFDGTLDLMVAGNPGNDNVLTELYSEIFGNKGNAQSINIPGQALRRFSDLEAHLPQMEIDNRPMPLVSGFRQEAAELIRCSYYRGVLIRRDGQLPQHLGVIMDGNRRYSRNRGLGSVLAGHQVGAHKLLQVITWSLSAGIRNLTVWALSDDNLKRGPQELDPLFDMMAEYIRETMMGDAPFSIPDVRFRVVGDRSILPYSLNEMVGKAEAATSHNTKFNLQLAIGYGGRSEIKMATKMAVRLKMREKSTSLEEAMETITDSEISQQMYSAQLGLPHIDAIVRTSGENRLSGFALWESHHAEFVIVNENWPALRQSTFLRSLLDLSKRNRRLGA